MANEACDGDRVSVNGREAKASYQVKIGDVIEIAFGNRTLRVEVTDISENAKKADAAANNAAKYVCIWDNTFAASAYDLKANSLLAPVRMTMSQSGSAGNYIIWDLQ